MQDKIEDGQTITGYCDKQPPVDMLASDESSSSSSSSPEDNSGMPVRPPLPYPGMPGMPGMMEESTESDPEDDLPGPPSASQPNTRAWKRKCNHIR